MATVALGIAGAAVGSVLLPGLGTIGGMAIGSAIGGAVGAGVGSFIDNKFLYPAIFKQPGQTYTGPRLDDMQLQTASEGTPIKFVAGAETRIAGQIIMLSKLIEETRSTTTRTGKGGGGGGGGGSQTTTEYLYYVHVAIGWCEGSTNHRVRKIWADTKLIYDDSVLPFTGAFGNSPTGVGSGIGATYVGSNRRCTFEASGGFTGDFRTFLQPGKKIVVSGYTDAALNGTFELITVTQTTFVGQRISTPAISSNAGIEWSSTASFTTQAFVDTRFTSLVNYSGSDVQAPNSLLVAVAQSEYASSTCPGFQGTCYTVLEKFALRDFGNRLPSFSALIETDEELPVGQAIARIIQRANVPVPYDTSEVRGTLRGFVVNDNTSIVAQLEPIMLAYNVGVVEDNGVLVFYSRGREHVVPIDPAKLASFEHGSGGGDTPRLFELTQVPTFDVPSEVTVQHFDPANNFQQGGQSERRINSESLTVQNMSLPITMESRKARDLARRLVYSMNVEAVDARFSLPGTYSYIQEGDIVTFTAYGEAWSIRVDSVERGYNHLLNFTGVLAESNTYRSRSQADTSTQPPPPPPYSPPPLVWHVMDLPPLRSTEVDGSPVMVWATCAEDITRQWRGAALFESFSGSAYTQVAATGSETGIGVCNTTLGVGPLDQWDMANTLDVTVNQGVLESKTDLEVLNGANRAVVGGEIIGFVNAVLIGTNQYRLSRLIRGQRDTRDDVGTHAANERFIRLDDNGLNIVQIEAAQVNVAKLHKSVATDGAVADVLTSTTLTPTGRNLRQFAPCRLRHTGTAATTVNVSWTRRSRAITRLFGNSFPINHTDESYVLKFYDGSDVLRKTVTVTGATTFAYTQSARIADFGFNPTFMRLRIGQNGPLGVGNLAVYDMNL